MNKNISNNDMENDLTGCPPIMLTGTGTVTQGGCRRFLSGNNPQRTSSRLDNLPRSHAALTRTHTNYCILVAPVAMLAHGVPTLVTLHILLRYAWISEECPSVDCARAITYS